MYSWRLEENKVEENNAHIYSLLFYETRLHSAGLSLSCVPLYLESMGGLQNMESAGKNVDFKKQFLYLNGTSKHASILQTNGSLL